jgi:hypothetical protein
MTMPHPLAKLLREPAATDKGKAHAKKLLAKADAVDAAFDACRGFGRNTRDAARRANDAWEKAREFYCSITGEPM